MQLEKLNQSKFAAFKGSEITNALNVKGGACEGTYDRPGGPPTDTYNV